MEQTDSCQRREGTGWKKVKELAKKTYIRNTHKTVCDSQRERVG